MQEPPPVLFPFHCWWMFPTQVNIPVSLLVDVPGPTAVLFPFHCWASFLYSPVSLLVETDTTVHMLLVVDHTPSQGRLIPHILTLLIIPSRTNQHS